MSELPSGWELPSLSDICQFNPKHDPDADRAQQVSFVPMPVVSDGTGTIENPQDRPLSEVWKGYTHFQDGDVIFAKITPCMENGKIAVASGLTNGMACGSTEFHVLRPDGGILPEYIWRFLRQIGFRKDAESQMTGAVGQRRVPKQYLEQHAIPLPPLWEQKRIVKKLDTLTERTTKTRTHLASVAKLVVEFRAALLDRYLVLVEAESDWMPSKLEAVRSQEATIRYGVVQPGDAPNDGVPLIRVMDMLGGKIAWDQLRTISQDTEKAYANARVENDDILVSVVGTIGRVALVSGMTERTSIARAVTRVRPNKALVDPKWLFWRLNASDVQERFRGDVREVARKTLNVGLIKQTPFKLPPLSVQRQTVRVIEAELSKIDLLALEAAKALKLTDHLDERMLAKAFAGGLVAQDPNDEPAGVLLERIQEERKSRPKQNMRNSAGRKAASNSKKKAEDMHEKKRSDVSETHLSGLLEQLGGSSAPRDLWLKSEMNLDEFYKLLRDEVVAGRIEEIQNKTKLLATNAT